MLKSFIGNDIGNLKDNKKAPLKELFNGGDRGIRTLDKALQPYDGLANRCLQPLGHVSCAVFSNISGSRMQSTKTRYVRKNHLI